MQKEPQFPVTPVTGLETAQVGAELLKAMSLKSMQTAIM